MREELKTYMEEDMQKLPFVNWDRFIEFGDDLDVYGWIDRKDSYKDFVLFKYKYIQEDDDWEMSYSNSSDKYSKAIFELLLCPGIHESCKRVEHFFKIENCVKLDLKDNKPVQEENK